LISNSLKHAFNDMSLGEVSVEFSAINQSLYRLIIGDNGSGSHSEILSDTVSSTGVTLIKTFVRQLNGTITTLNRNKGVHFEITFPNLY